MSRSLELVLRGLASPALYVLLLATVIGCAVPYAVQRALLSGMDEERRNRVWNALTWACVLWWVPSPLAMMGFAWVTRRGPGRREAARAIGWGLVLAGVMIAFEVVSYEAVKAALKNREASPRGGHAMLVVRADHAG